MKKQKNSREILKNKIRQIEAITKEHTHTHTCTNETKQIKKAKIQEIDPASKGNQK